MYAGHFAAALGLRAASPRTPTWVCLVGAVWLDLLNGLALLSGLERITPHPGVTLGVDLTFIDWTHSLAMALAWSLAFGALFLRRGGLLSLTASVAAFSHWLLDFPMHPGDLAAWPHSALHLGLGLWRAWPVGWWFFEGAVILAGCGAYLWRALRTPRFARLPALVCLVVLALHLTNSPWLSPAR